MGGYEANWRVEREGDGTVENWTATVYLGKKSISEEKLKTENEAISAAYKLARKMGWVLDDTDFLWNCSSKQLKEIGKSGNHEDDNIGTRIKLSSYLINKRIVRVWGNDDDPAIMGKYAIRVIELDDGSKIELRGIGGVAYIAGVWVPSERNLLNLDTDLQKG